MEPLSPLTYLRRHKGQTLLLASLIALVVCGVSITVGMTQPIVEHVSVVGTGYLNFVSVVAPSGSLSPSPEIGSLIRANPDVAQVISENGNGITMMVPSIVASSATRVWGLAEEDVERVLELCRLRLREGRLFRPRSAEIVMSKEIADALGLRVGDQISRMTDDRYYYDLREPLTLVGILENNPSVGITELSPVAIVSYEYLDSHEMYAPRPVSLLVFAQDGRRSAVNEFLETDVQSPRAQVMTLEKGERLIANVRRMTNIIFVVIDSLVASVVALVVGTINWIALTKRLPDLGIMHAVGREKNRLIRSVTFETAIVAGLGWLVGLAAGWLALAWLRTAFYQPQGMDLNLADLKPLWFAAPVPLAVIGFAAYNVRRVLARLDTVQTIERGKLGTEKRHYHRSTDSVRPLSSWIYYLRHPRRGVGLVMLMGLVILGVAFPAFFLLPTIDVQEPFYLNRLAYMSQVSPGLGLAVDPGLIGQMRAHPAVERVIPVKPLSLAISIPPASLMQAGIYGVYADDLPFLMEQLELEVVQGRLPHAHSNEVTLSMALVLNRDLQVGDSIGLPVEERDVNIPTELEIVGVLSGDVEIGFVSAEYLESHELYAGLPTNLYVAPREGRKAEMDNWLRANVPQSGDRLATYDESAEQGRLTERNMVILIAAVESIVAFVAAAALAALNNVFFSQRQDELGVLYAIGRSRRWIALRTAGETTVVSGLAWTVGAILCLAALALAQANMYGPVGLRLDWTDLTPWILTLPLPIAVIGVSTGTVLAKLGRLDPVSIVERR